MLSLLAFVSFLVATILEAVKETWLFPSSLAWVAMGLAFMAMGGAWGFVNSKLPR